MSTTLVAGVDTSTQSCKVVVRDADSGELVRSGSAAHPSGTSVDPKAWWTAWEQAASEAGGLDDVAAIAVGGQQHGMVCLDESGCGRARRAAVERHPLRRCRRGARRRAARRCAGLGGRGRLGAGGIVHRDQAALARRARTRQRGAHRRGVPAARLADVAAARQRHAGRAGHRPRRRQRHRLLVAGGGRVPRRPAAAGVRRASAAAPRARAGRGGRPDTGRSAGRPRHGRQRGRRSRGRPPNRAT